jgi:hypothetical protein
VTEPGNFQSDLGLAPVRQDPVKGARLDVKEADVARKLAIRNPLPSVERHRQLDLGPSKGQAAELLSTLREEEELQIPERDALLLLFDRSEVFDDLEHLVGGRSELTTLWHRT